MMDEARKYILLELRGGPKDGEKFAYRVDGGGPPHELAFPRPMPLAFGIEASAESITAPTYRYISVDSGYRYDTMMVSIEMLMRSILPQEEFLALMMKTMRPFILTFQG